MFGGAWRERGSHVKADGELKKGQNTGHGDFPAGESKKRRDPNKWEGSHLADEGS